MIEEIDKIRIELETILLEYDKIDLLSKLSLVIFSGEKNKQLKLLNDVPGLQFLVGLSLKTNYNKKKEFIMC